MSDTLYKFLPAEFALRVLEEKRVKVSTVNDLNDIYDFSSSIDSIAEKENALSDKELLQKLIIDSYDIYGIICLSKTYRSPLLWGHYARGATGITIGFDSGRMLLHPWNDRVDVHYNESRPSFMPPYPQVMDMMRYRIVKQLAGQKAKEWKYEEEARYIVELDKCEPSGGLYFADFDRAYLVRVIAGPRFVNFSYLVRLINNQGLFSHVKVSKAKEHPTRYEIHTE